MLSSISQSRWFALADLCLALACALAWAFFGSWGWLILAVASLPWLVRVATGHFPFRRTAFDSAMLLFLLTAGIGVWAAYDRAAAWEKFWWLVAACRLYYALAEQRRENFFAAAMLVTGTAALLCLLFLLTFDWVAHPLLGPVDRIGADWMALRPNLSFPTPEPDFIGGLVAMLLPLALAVGIETYRRRDYASLATWVIIGLVLGLGLVMSAERPAWLGLLLAGGLWLGWQSCVRLARHFNFRAEIIAGAGLGITLATGALLGSMLWQHYANRGSVPGRAEEIVNGVHLLASYPLIGGGLAATPGLYSRYVLGIPYLYLPNLHNQYLNLGIEQGFAGLGAILWIFTGALLGLRPKESAQNLPGDPIQSYRWAIGLGILIFAWHSLMEDVAYSNWGAIWLLLLPGLAASLPAPASQQRAVPARRRALAVSAAILLLVAGFRPLMAVWHANLGAVRMSQVQLAGWPEQLVDSKTLLTQIGPAEREFERALYWADHPVADYRLGLIANERREFEHANAHLLSAFERRPYHRGIHKALGYSYAWVGKIDMAEQALRAIPEAAYELSIYAQWWASQKLNNLSNYALQIAHRLEKK